ncbi:MAG TPA: heavy-metal-associated domain-containing protein [Chloroflexaceae bacterium]|nr:heavy-metal-associated domain-containing protein [Chloroflexaceae bacterium]
MKTEQFHVPGVSCQHCVRAVTAEVGKLAGVSNVQVNLDNKVVTVEHGEGVAPEAIVAAIKEAGYEEVAPVAA